jgi:hypothetical protein
MAADVTDVLRRAGSVLAELRAIDLDGVDDDTLADAVLAMERVRGGFDAAEARLLARWDAQGGWRASGAKTAAAWLSWHQRIPIQVARQRLRHARAVRDLPAVVEAWANGDIDRAHVTTLLEARNPRTRETFDRDHQRLLDLGREHSFSSFKRACDHWSMAADPDGAERGAEDDRAARELHLSESIGGLWFGRLTLDPVSGTIVDTTLGMIEQELFEQDWAAAKQRVGREPAVLDLARTPAQRRADALVEMATRARTAPVGGRRPAPLFTVVCGLETLTGPILELFNRRIITPGTAAAHLTKADVERIVFDGPSRVVDVGAKRRFFTGALRRAIEVRDRTCFHPSCNEVPRRPEMDHIHEHAKGGETTQDNGSYACGFHNRDRYHHPERYAARDDEPPSAWC